MAIILDHESTTDSPGHHACRFFRKNNCGAVISPDAIQTSGHPLWKRLKIRIGEGIHGEREVEREVEKRRNI